MIAKNFALSVGNDDDDEVARGGGGGGGGGVGGFVAALPFVRAVLRFTLHVRYLSYVCIIFSPSLASFAFIRWPIR